MEEHQVELTSVGMSPPPAHAQSSTTTTSDHSSRITFSGPTGNVNDTGTVSIQMQEQQEASTSDVIASLAQELTAQLTSPAQSSTTTPISSGHLIPITIGMVDKHTREVDREEYNPHHVSIGPYHWSINSDLTREKEKRDSLRAVLRSARGTVTETAVRELLQRLAPLEDDSRSCYAHSFPEMDQQKFLNMLLLDGSYLLHRLGLLVDCNADSNNRLDLSVVRDVLYLAENQIPFVVLWKIHEFIVPGTSLADVVGRMKEYVGSLLEKQEYSVANPEVHDPVNAGNLLHLLHMHFQPTNNLPADATGKVRRWRTATDYYITAGVKFKKRSIGDGTDEAKCILDVKLHRGTLIVPCLTVDDQTCRILRNLMALEQMNPWVGNHVTAYCAFISQLACTTADVELLSRNRIIEHSFGSHEEMAKCFANLCKGNLFDIDDPNYNYLRATCQELEAWFQSRPWRWMAGLEQKYFSSPWSVMALAAATIILVCTVVQAVYSVLAYRPAPPR